MSVQPDLDQEFSKKWCLVLSKTLNISEISKKMKLFFGSGTLITITHYRYYIYTYVFEHYTKLTYTFTLILFSS